MNYDRAKLKQQAKDLIKDNTTGIASTKASINILIFICIYITFLILNILSRTSIINEVVFLILIIILFFVFASVFIILSVGYCVYYLNISDGNERDYRDILSPFGEGIKSIILNIITYILRGIILAILSALFFIGFYFFIILSQVPYIRAENPDIGVIESFRESIRIIKGREKDFLFLHLSFMGLFILSMITLGFLLIYVVPYYNASMALFYRTLNDDDYIQQFKSREKIKTVVIEKKAVEGAFAPKGGTARPRATVAVEDESTAIPPKDMDDFYVLGNEPDKY